MAGCVGLVARFSFGWSWSLPAGPGHCRPPGRQERLSGIIWRAGGPVRTSGVPLARAPCAGRRRRTGDRACRRSPTSFCKQRCD